MVKNVSFNVQKWQKKVGKTRKEIHQNYHLDTWNAVLTTEPKFSDIRPKFVRSLSEKLRRKNILFQKETIFRQVFPISLEHIKCRFFFPAKQTSTKVRKFLVESQKIKEFTLIPKKNFPFKIILWAHRLKLLQPRWIDIDGRLKIFHSLSEELNKFLRRLFFVRKLPMDR